MQITPEAIADPLKFFAEENYAWGSLQAIRYDPRSDIFPQPYMWKIYELLRTSGRTRMGSLPQLFCGMPNLTPDAICHYMAQQQVVVLGEWRPNPSVPDPLDPLPEDFEALTAPVFHPLGITFPATFTQDRTGQANSAMGAYGFFQEAWRTPKQLVLSYLGLSWLFYELRLVSLHGIRYADNKLTARWMSQFGFKDVGVLPDYMLDQFTGQLRAAAVSTVSRKRFEEVLRRAIIPLLEDGQPGE